MEIFKGQDNLRAVEPGMGFTVYLLTKSFLISTAKLLSLSTIFLSNYIFIKLLKILLKNLHQRHTFSSNYNEFHLLFIIYYESISFHFSKT